MSRVMNPSVIGSQTIRRQRTFTKADLIKTKFIFSILFLVAFTAILSLFYIWSRVQIVNYGYEINQLKREQNLLLEQKKKWHVELAMTRSPQKLEYIAHQKLNMKPASELYIKLLE